MVPPWRNGAGHALSDPHWLDGHHRAKLRERSAFAERLAALKPRRIVDIGCGTGLWLHLLDRVVDPGCELVGIDDDAAAIDIARRRSWTRDASFILGTVEETLPNLPRADLVLMFNMFGYLPDPGGVVTELVRRTALRHLAVRQYDGSIIRLGPLDPRLRSEVDSAVFASMSDNNGYRHYELDRTFEVLYHCGLVIEHLQFEKTERFSPFSADFQAYVDGTVQWLHEHLPRPLSSELKRAEDAGFPSYFVEVDLTAILSSSADAS